MKYLAVLFVAVQAIMLQASALPVITTAPSQIIAAPNSVAYNLADTLNLLTVSSLLSGALPYQPVAKIPLAIPPCASYAPACANYAPACANYAPACAIAPSTCGCGCSSNYYY